jgi:hypothetical protein
MFTIGPHPWQLRGEFLVTVGMAGCRLDVLARPVEHAVRRRRVAGPSAGRLQRAELVALAGLPAGVPVPWAELDLETRLTLDTAPAGVLRASRRTVTRLYRPPVEVEAVVSSQRPWERGLQEVSLFATVAPRVLRVSRRPHDVNELHTRAERLGVGVFIDGEPPRPLTGPPSQQRVQEDARRWEFAEAVYLAYAS